jgi:hypothetical protein
VQSLIMNQLALLRASRRTFVAMRMDRPQYLLACGSHSSPYFFWLLVDIH